MKKIVVFSAFLALFAPIVRSADPSSPKELCGQAIALGGLAGAALATEGTCIRAGLRILVGDLVEIRTREALAAADLIILAKNVTEDIRAAKKPVHQSAYKALQLAAAVGGGYTLMTAINDKYALPDVLFALLGGYSVLKFGCFVNRQQKTCRK